MSNDKETQAQLDRAASIEAMLGSNGWKHAEEDLQDFVSELRDIRTVPKEGDIAANLLLREGIAQALEEWVDGLKSQVNNGIMMESEYIDNLVVRR